MNKSKPTMTFEEAFNQLPEDFKGLLPNSVGPDAFLLSSVMLGGKVRQEFPLKPEFKDSALGRWQEMTITMLCLYYPYSELRKFYDDAKYVPKPYGPIEDAKDFMLHTVLMYSFTMIRTMNYGDGIQYAIGHTGKVGRNVRRQRRSAGIKGRSQPHDLKPAKEELIIRRYSEIIKLNPDITAREAARQIIAMKDDWDALGMKKPWCSSGIRECINKNFKKVDSLAK